MLEALQDDVPRTGQELLSLGPWLPHLDLLQNLTKGAQLEVWFSVPELSWIKGDLQTDIVHPQPAVYNWL
jgi:hypothetical protein